MNMNRRTISQKLQRYFIDAVCAGAILLTFTSVSVCQAPKVFTGKGIPINRYLKSMVDSGFSGQVIVTEKGKSVLDNAYGWTDKSKTSRMTEHILINIASISKSFTSVAVFKLIEEHRLNLTDSLPKFFHNVPPDKRSITIKNLLSHTSGFPQHYSADGVTERDAAVAAFFRDTLKFTPGSDFFYSNEDYELLAAIIEVVSGEPYETFLRQNILEKAGMRETKFWAEDSLQDLPLYAGKNKPLEPDVLRRNYGYIGGEGIYTTAADLYRWFNALNERKLIDSTTIDVMWSVQWKAKSADITYGWFRSKTANGNEEIWTRGYEDWGHSGYLRWFPEKQILIIVLTNSPDLHDTPMRSVIADEIVKMMVE